MLFHPIEPPGRVREVPEWQAIRPAVDSGVSRAMIGEEVLRESRRDGAGGASARGDQYEVANGAWIPSLNESRSRATPRKARRGRSHPQVCDAN